MPQRVLIAQQLAGMFSILSHPVRIRIIAELRNGELCVNALQQILQIGHSGVSQHLALLRAHRLIKEHKEGRHVYYRLSNQKMAAWLVDGITFITPDHAYSELLRSAAAETAEQWSDSSDHTTNQLRVKEIL
ncbi:MAG: metalloregulator ArsR/SmtB family transcription factor [Candidatus Obscuribacterales bacterium]|nr:metalloregulator ArsR/SmtB family transcription factor [Candidatus Obscuribacterales bacterium]